MSDAELVERFERGDVEELHHADHVRVAYAYLRTMPLLEAIARFTAALRRFAAAHGKPELYHETINLGVLIDHPRAPAARARRMERVHSRQWRLLRWKPSVLETYYSADVLQSELARRLFVLPRA